MIQFKKMSRTAVSAAVLVALGAAANAGTVTTSAVLNVAQEAFGTGVDATTAVVIPAATAIGYQFSTPGGIVINPGGTIHVTVTPTGAKFSAAGSVTLPTGTGGNLAGVATVNTTSGVLDIALTNAATSLSNAVIGVGGVVSVGGASVKSATGLAAGTVVSASGSVGVAAAGTELEAASAATTLITSSQAVSVAATAFADTAKIDVTTTTTANIGKVLTLATASGNVETLGSVTFTNSTTVAKELASTNAVNLANTNAYPAANTPITYTLNLVSGTFSAGASYSLATGGCGGTSTPVVSTQAPTAITAATTSVTLSSLAVPVSGTSIYVCGTFPGNAAIAPYKASVAAVLTGTGTYLGETLAATNLYDLGYNGASVTVRNYIPSGVTGYIQTVRLINTGSSAATAYVSLIDDTTGAASTPVAVGSSMAAGSSYRLSQATIEAALGYTAASPMPSTIRPRLRFTAATGSMEVQSLFNNTNGAYTNLSGQDTN